MSDMNLKILQVMPEFGVAGAEIMCESLVNEFLKSPNVTIYVVSLYNYKSPITQRLEEKGVKIFYLDKRKGLDLSMIFKLFKLMKKLQINVVHTHRYVMQYAIPAADLARVPIRVHTLHSVAQKENGKLARILASFFYKFRHVVPVAISPRVKDTVYEVYHISEFDIPMVFNGIDLSLCQKKDNYVCQKDVFSFIHIGRLITLKNQELIINSVKLLHNQGIKCRVLFLGEGENLTYYRKITSDLDLNDSVLFCGMQSDVHPFLHEADAFLLPSIYEGMPMSLIEAMGSGLPIIASNVGGVPDMIDNQKNGILITPELDELVCAMKTLILNKDMREFLGKNALAKARTFSSQRMMNSYYDIYKSRLH